MMARYIDADEAIKVILSGKIDDSCSLVECPEECNSFLDAAADDISKMPTADVVEVVRCKDCKHRIIDTNDDWCECTGCDINPDGFCEEGERRENE